MDSFYKAPTVEVLDSFKKKEITEVGNHYELELPENASKADIKKIIFEYLVEEEFIFRNQSRQTI